MTRGWTASYPVCDEDFRVLTLYLRHGVLSGDTRLELTNAGEAAAREIRKRYAGCYDVVVEFENHWKLKMADFASKWWKIEGKKQQAMRRGESVHGEDGTILKRRGGRGLQCDDVGYYQKQPSGKA